MGHKAKPLRRGNSKLWKDDPRGSNSALPSKRIHEQRGVHSQHSSTKRSPLEEREHFRLRGGIHTGQQRKNRKGRNGETFFVGLIVYWGVVRLERRATLNLLEIPNTGEGRLIYKVKEKRGQSSSL